MTIALRRIDHVVLTVADLAATIAFYERVLGMRHVVFGERHALHFGDSKINLHPEVNDFPPELKAAAPTLGSGDLCLVADGPIDAIAEHLRACGIEIIDGPVARDGALGEMTSVYFRDPDANLVEVSVYDDDQGITAP
jgi:catechol 2,3-dioxygenase-like lactoylglutathione lyase family enzyme